MFERDPLRVIVEKIKTGPDIDDMKDELDSKGHMTVGMPDATVKKAHGMMKTHRLHTSTFTGNTDRANDNIKKMKGKGWSVVHHEDNYDNHAILYSKEK